MYLYAYEDGLKVRQSDIEALLKDEGVFGELPVSIEIFWKIIKK